MKSCTVRVPATSANCGPGFDCLGMALCLYNTFTFTPDEKATTYSYSFHGVGAPILQAEPAKNNLIGQSMEALFKCRNQKALYGHVEVQLNIPPARGLGSSSSAIVAGLLIGNAYVDMPLTKVELLAIATELEGHPDNVAPALLGNLCVAIYENKHIFHSIIKVPEELQLITVIPDILVKTKAARDVLPSQINYEKAVKNVGYSSLFVSSMALGNWTNLQVALQDNLHVPYRLDLIPHCKEVLTAAVMAGALGATISGSGSTLIAYTVSDAEKIGEAMVGTFVANQIKAEYHVLSIDQEGAMYCPY